MLCSLPCAYNHDGSNLKHRHAVALPIPHPYSCCCCRQISGLREEDSFLFLRHPLPPSTSWPRQLRRIICFFLLCCTPPWFLIGWYNWRRRKRIVLSLLCPCPWLQQSRKGGLSYHSSSLTMAIKDKWPHLPSSMPTSLVTTSVYLPSKVIFITLYVAYF